MQRADDLTVYLALVLALFAAFASVPQTGPGVEQPLLELLAAQALAIEMPLTAADGEQLFAGP